MQMTAGHAVAEVLAQLGVRKVIGVVGSCMLEILDGMYGRDDIQFLSTRHEQAAALMADGYGRIAGRPGVCIATNGPGATNLLTGVANAFHAQSPVLVITGAPMMKDMFRDSAQEIDQQAMFRPVVKWSVQVRKPELAAALTWEAYKRTMTGVPGPVHLDLPRDVLNETVELPDMGGLIHGEVAAAAPEAEAVASAVRLLEKARRPVLLAGGGVLWSEASDEIVALSKRLEAPVMSSTGRDDVAPYSYPLYLGTIGRGALPEAQAFFKEADLVLAVGTSLGHTTTFWHPDFFAPGTKLIHIAQDRNNIGRVYPAQVGIQADARIALKALLRSVKLKGVTRPGWLKKAARVRAAQERHRNKAAGYNSRPLDPRRAHAALRKVLPKDAIITLDAGVGPGYVYEYQTFEQPPEPARPSGTRRHRHRLPRRPRSQARRAQAPGSHHQRRRLLSLQRRRAGDRREAKASPPPASSSTTSTTAPSAPTRSSTTTSATSATPSATRPSTNTPASSGPPASGSPSRPSWRMPLRRPFGWERANRFWWTCCAHLMSFPSRDARRR